MGKGDEGQTEKQAFVDGRLGSEHEFTENKGFTAHPMHEIKPSEEPATDFARPQQPASSDSGDSGQVSGDRD